MNTEKMLAECRAQWEASSGGSVFADYWLGWKAGLEALEVELPVYCNCCYEPSEVAENFIEAIEAAGVRVAK